MDPTISVVYGAHGVPVLQISNVRLSMFDASVMQRQIFTTLVHLAPGLTK